MVLGTYYTTCICICIRLYVYTFYIYIYICVCVLMYVCVCACACARARVHVCLCMAFNFLRLSRLALNTAWGSGDALQHVAAESHVRTLKSILIVLAWICHLDAVFECIWPQVMLLADGL